MNVTCPNCATIYRVDPAKVPEAGVRARCAVCAAVFAVRREATSAGTPAMAGVTATPAGVAEAAAPAAPHAPPPAPEPAPAAPEPSPTPPPAAPVTPPAPEAPPPPRPEPPARQPYPPQTEVPHRQPTAAAAAAAAPRPPVARPAGLPGGGIPPRPAVSRPSPPQAPPASAGAGAGSAAAGAVRKPVNPFLSQDPGQKARRLARALISDMVVYHPAKRREGLRDGTLKALFEEEIKKSWEEYTDQVGRDVAESTTHFKDALNEILADGRQIF